MTAISITLDGTKTGDIDKESGIVMNHAYS